MSETLADVLWFLSAWTLLSQSLVIMTLFFAFLFCIAFAASDY